MTQYRRLRGPNWLDKKPNALSPLALANINPTFENRFHPISTNDLTPFKGSKQIVVEGFQILDFIKSTHG